MLLISILKIKLKGQTDSGAIVFNFITLNIQQK